MDRLIKTCLRTVICLLILLNPCIANATNSDDGDTHHLPLIVINTHGQAIPDDPKIAVFMGIIDNGPNKTNRPTDPFNDYNGLIGIELRGSSSQQFPKKSFGFETWDHAGNDSSVSLLGFPSETDWVLYAPYSDKSLLRNSLAYYMFGRFGHYSPRTKFVELYLNGQYRGIYVLVEKIKGGPSRVDIDNLTAADIRDLELTGGYILKLDKSTGDENNEGFYSRNAPIIINRPHFFIFDDPDGDEIQPAQRNYIRNKVNDFEASLRSTYYKDPEAGYRSYLDVQSFVDFFIINEISRNIDGLRLSSYLYKDRDDRDPRFHAGPAWDYDIAFGNCYYGGADLSTGWQYLYEEDDHPIPFWWERLMTDNYFTGNLRCRWNQLREGVLHTDSLNDYIDGLVELIGDAATRNFASFPILGSYVWPNPYIGNTYQEEVIYLKNWISQRASWLDGNMPGTCAVTGGPEHKKHGFQAFLYPNPANDQINLEILNPEKKKLQLSLYHVTGHLVYSESLEEAAQITRNIKLPSGIYQVILRDHLEHITLKAIVN